MFIVMLQFVLNLLFYKFSATFLFVYLQYWLPLAVTTPPPPPPFSPGFLGKSSRDDGPKIPPFPEKMGICMWPPHTFEWGAGPAYLYPLQILESRTRRTQFHKLVPPYFIPWLPPWLVRWQQAQTCHLFVK